MNKYIETIEEIEEIEKIVIHDTKLKKVLHRFFGIA